ncbi:hypothetical protein [Carboxylicivirga sp. N1Y90]|uniref:hypothetical protein n=1 Tax=Carboxylicivirga fragile TaxID=3417571 RepID=UPI003D335B30|nr:hypothetical protein [Marinilabiliaceae bacterium N1Y90]
MKRLIIYSICLIAILQNSYASKVHQDTLILKMPNGVMIEQLVHYRAPGDVKVFDKFQTYLSTFLEQFKKLETDAINDQQPMRIEFNNIVKHFTSKEYSISFEDYKPKTKITLVDTNNLHHINQRIHLLVLSNNSKYNHYKARVHFSDMSQLNKLLDYDFEKINNELAASFKEEEYKFLKRKPFSSWIKVNDKSETTLEYNQIPEHPTDVIQLSAGTGLQSIKSVWLGSFHARMTLILPRKMVDKHSFTFGYQWLYNFTSPSEKNINEFIDVGYAFNFSDSPSKDKWAGIDIGFLIKRRGDFFDNNTFRLGLYTNLNKSVTVGPQMYFNDFFKNVYPGVNINIAIL